MTVPLNNWRVVEGRICSETVAKQTLIKRFALSLSGSRRGGREQPAEGGHPAPFCEAAGGGSQTQRGEGQTAGNRDMSTCPPIGHVAPLGLSGRLNQGWANFLTAGLTAGSKM